MEYSKLKFALYTRKSTEDSSKQVQSIPDQIKLMSEKAETLGIKLKPRKDVFQESKSAKMPGIRTEFSRLIKEIQDGKYNAVICWSTSRLARNPQESGVIQQLLQDGVLKCIVTNEKTYYPEDNAIIFAVEMGMHSQFVRDLMAGVRRGMHTKAERGIFPGVPPVGYKNDRENKTIVCDPDRFALVRQMWDLMLLGNYTVSEITRIADKEWGFRTLKRKKRGDKPLSISTVYSMLQNPFYVGYVRYSGKLYKGQHTAMVTQQEFDTVQSFIKRKNTARPQETELDERDPFPYRGIVKCGECGCLITYTRRVKQYKNGNSQVFEYCYCTRRRQDFVCTNRISISPQEMTKQIREEIAKYEIIDDFFQWACKYLREFDDAENSVQEHVFEAQTKTIKATENELRELNRMRYRLQVDDEFYKSEKQLLENRLVLLRGQFNDQEETNKQHRKKLEKYFNFARYAKEDFESDDDLKRKEVLSIVGQNLLFKDGLLWFEPIPYLTPLMPKYQKLKARYDDCQTWPEQRREAAIKSIISAWYAWQDSNLRPLAPQANALSS